MKWVLLVVLYCLFGPSGLYAQRAVLGPEINTDAYDESAPLISSDGRFLYFWSLNRPDSYGVQDIYTTQLDSLSRNWLPAQNIGTPLNDPDCNVALALTPDGNQLLIYKVNRRPGFADLAICRKYPQGWGPAVPIKIEGFESQGAGLTAYLAADGRTLLLSIRADDSRGREDLYVSFYQSASRSWSAPRNLGPTLNTEMAEVTPFLASDGITLYFSSNGRGGLGGDDIFLTRRLDDTWTRWSPPQNLGRTINSAGNDYYFKFPLDAKFGYLVSDFGRATKDIFRVKLPPEVLPKPVMRVTGKVLDQDTKQPLAGRIIYQDLKTGEELGAAVTDTTTSQYTILLPGGKTYGFLADAPGYMAVSENINVQLPAGRMYAETERELYLARLKAGQKIRLNNLFFGIGLALLKPESYPELQRVAKTLQDNPSMIIEVSGHTDSTGVAAANQSLSELRAKAAVDYLLTLGVSPNRVFPVGYGSTRPVATNATNQGRALNRRVEIEILLISN